MAEYSEIRIPLRVTAEISDADKLVDKLSQVENKLDQVANKAEKGESKFSQFAAYMSKTTGEVGRFTASLAGTGSKIGNFTSKLSSVVGAFKRIMFYRMVRSVIREIGQAFGEGINNLYQWSRLVDGEFAKSMDTLATSALYAKNSLGAMVSPIINALAPAVDFLVDKFVALLNVINQVFALLSGATMWNKAIKYPTQYAKAVGGASSAAKKLGLAGIDQLTILSKASGSGGGGFNANDYMSMFEKVGISERLTNAFEAVKSAIQKHLDSIFVILSGAALVLGAILLFTGANIPLGLGLIAVGAYGLAREITANWDSMTPELKATISTITGVVGGAMLTLGAILAFSGANIPLGVALLALGAVSLATGMIVNWGTLGGNVQNSISEIGGIVSGALLALGGVLAFSGANVPLGIALMAAGAVGVAASIVVSWNNLENPIRRTIANIATIVSTALLGLGAVLAFSGANVPLGIALIAAGAVGMATAIINWNYASDKVRQSMTAVSIIAGMSLLALGLMLVLTGAAAPLGFGMIIAGGMALASAVAINWNYIPDKINSTLKTTENNIKTWWNNFKRDIETKWNNFKSWWGNLRLPEFHIKTPHISWSTQPAGGWVASILSALGMPTSIPKMNISWYAKGGFPNAGDLFIANEAGAEMVGSMNGHTAVANQQEITAGIREGVYDAMMAAMSSGGFSANVYLDGKQISGSVVKNINSETRRTGSSPLLAM